MHRREWFRGLWLLLSLLVVSAPCSAQEPRKAPAPTRAAATEAANPPADAITQHTVEVAGRRLEYKATAGTIPLYGPKEEVAAHVFYTAFVAESPAAPRPVTFVFNGGPGAASAFLNLGAIGPRVVPFNADGSAPLQPVRLEDNPDTWLAFTDLVFVDPVSTGFSRAVGGDEEAKDKFFGVDKDVAAMVAFVQRYLTRAGRLLDPVFLVGESYGGFRVAYLTRRLLRAGLDVRGAVLISPAIEFSLIRGDDLLLLPNALAFPSIALSHLAADGRGEPTPGQRSEIEAFARGPYLLHLASGKRDAAGIIDRVQSYTGLPLDEVRRLFGRVGVGDYARHVRRATGRAISLYDGTVAVELPRPVGEHHPDPILDYAVTALAPAFTSYARGELGYATEQPYRLLNREVSGRWDYGTSAQRQGYAGALGELEAARAQRPSLWIMIAGGSTDLVTPYAVSGYLIDQMKPIEGAPAVALKVYAGGHMMYLRAASRRALSADARDLYAAAQH